MSYALLFPGQGSQYAGMGLALSRWSQAARETMEEADDVLGTSLSRLCFEGPEEQLALTENTQPAILAVSVAALRAIRSQLELAPAFVAGHSLGEYSALVAAGSIAFSHALTAVRERGRAMQEAVPAGEGGMAALLGMERSEVEEICALASGEGRQVTPANFNCPGQIVVAGHLDRVRRAVELFRQRGGRRAVELPVSAPFHCPLMEPAARRMEQLLGEIPIDSPKTLLINNAQARTIDSAAEVLPSLVAQITSPVLWEDSLRVMLEAGTGRFLELGPGRVLAGLLRKTDRQARAVSFGEPEQMEEAAELIRGREES